MANFLSQIFFSTKVIPKLLLHERKKPLPIFFFLFHKLSHVYTASTHIALFVRPFEGEHSEEEGEKKNRFVRPSVRDRSSSAVVIVVVVVVGSFTQAAGEGGKRK